MTDKKISELASITGANVSDANDVLPIVDTSEATTKKITRAELFKSVSNLDINGTLTVGGDALFDGDTAKVEIKSFSPTLTFTDDSAVGAAADKFIIQSVSGQSLGDYEFVMNNDQTSSADVTVAKFYGNGDISFYGNIEVSGGVYLGGTTSANLLDDYEEGTFTPVIADAPSGGNEGSAADAYGHYTKIGRQVTVQITFVNIDTTGLTGASDLHITGLPFTAGSFAGSNNFTGAMSAARITSTADVVVPEILDSISYVRLREGFLSDSGSDWLLVSELTSESADLNITLTYFTE